MVGHNRTPPHSAFDESPASRPSAPTASHTWAAQHPLEAVLSGDGLEQHGQQGAAFPEYARLNPGTLTPVARTDHALLACLVAL